MKRETKEKLADLLARSGRGVASFVGDVWAVVSDELQAAGAAAPQAAPAIDPDKLLDVDEAAVLLKVEAGTLYTWASQGRIPFRKVGVLLRFHRGELMQWTIEQAGRVAQPKARRAKLSVVK